jgi:C-terminal domain on Strawberry notch homologue
MYDWISLQQLGRTHRANETSQPEYKLLISPQGGERRFASAVAKRLESLGALTQGDRSATVGAQQLNIGNYNFDTMYGKKALREMLTSLTGPSAYNIPFPVLPADLAQEAAVYLQQIPRGDPDGDDGEEDDDGYDLDRYAGYDEDNPPTFQDAAMGWLHSVGIVSKKFNQTAVKTFLNRILGLPTKNQQLLFDLFIANIDSTIAQAKKDDKFDVGIRQLPAAIKIESQPRAILTDRFSGDTIHHRIKIDQGWPWEKVKAKYDELIEEARRNYDGHEDDFDDEDDDERERRLEEQDDGGDLDGFIVGDDVIEYEDDAPLGEEGHSKTAKRKAKKEKESSSSTTTAGAAMEIDGDDHHQVVSSSSASSARSQGKLKTEGPGKASIVDLTEEDGETAAVATSSLVGSPTRRQSDRQLLARFGVGRAPPVTPESKIGFYIKNSYADHTARFMFLLDKRKDIRGTFRIYRPTSGARMINVSEMSNYRRIDSLHDAQRQWNEQYRSDFCRNNPAMSRYQTKDIISGNVMNAWEIIDDVYESVSEKAHTGLGLDPDEAPATAAAKKAGGPRIKTVRVNLPADAAGNKTQSIIGVELDHRYTNRVLQELAAAEQGKGNGRPCSSKRRKSAEAMREAATVAASGGGGVVGTNKTPASAGKKKQKTHK